MSVSMTTFDKSKPMPEWLEKEYENENTQRGQKYYVHLYNAQPIWADRKRINAIYKLAKKLRAQGMNVHVDHIFPLIHPEFCGLHIASNLRIVDAAENMSKSNTFYPGLEQLDFFKPEFFELEAQ